VRDVTPTETTDEVYGAGGALLWRYTGNSSDPNQRAYVAFNGGILAEYWSGGTLFDHPDELGSISTASDYTGNNFAERLFYPYGEVWTGIDLNGFNPHKTFAKLPDYDPEIDMYNTPNRHYSPNGRWPTPDPGGIRTVTLTDPQTWNKYAYARNNPTTLTDPSGLSPVTATNMAGNESDIAADWNPFWSNGAGPGVEVESEYSREEYLAVAGPHNSTPQQAQNTAGAQGTGQQQNGTAAQGAGQAGGQQGLQNQQLKFKTVSGGQGTTWEIQWSLTHNTTTGGWIVQHIVADFSGAGHYDYWEAWPVSANSHVSSLHGTDANGASYSDMFAGGSGSHIHASARFYEGLTPPSSFKVQPAGFPAGILKATTTNPNLSTQSATAPNVRWWGD
jgi:RHS repeat-associated protein